MRPMRGSFCHIGAAMRFQRPLAPLRTNCTLALLEAQSFPRAKIGSPERSVTFPGGAIGEKLAICSSEVIHDEPAH